MSYFSYGAPAGSTDPTQGVVLTYVFTHAIDDTPEYSDDGTEYLWTKRRLAIRGLINIRVPPSFLGATTPADVMNGIRQTLETPRRQLFFFQNGPTDPTALVQSPNAGFVVDAKNGPYPRRVAITRVTGSESLIVDLEYETYVVDCDKLGQSADPLYQSHRWSETVTIDDRALSTITRTGKVVVRSDIHNNPDLLRGIISPGIAQGFRRTKAEYQLQSDGLALMYTFVDQEQVIMPPGVAFKASGDYMETTAEGQQRYGEVYVRLEGAKDSVRAAMLSQAITIAIFKLDSANPIRLGKAWLLYGSVRQSLYDNIVEVRFRCQIQQQPARTQGAAIDLRRFTDPPVGSFFGDEEETPPDPTNRGSAELRLIANALNDPCLATYTRTGTDEAAPGDGLDRPTFATQDFPETSNATPEILFIPLLPTDTPSLHSVETPSGGLEGVFNEFQVQIRYGFDDQKLHLPTCGVGTGAAIVQLAAPTATKTVEFETMRTGALPRIPHPYELATSGGDTGSIATYLDGHVAFDKVEVMGDGVSPRYKISGYYKYAYKDTSQIVLSVPRPPYLDQGRTVEVRTVPEDIFDDGISEDLEHGTPGLWDQLREGGEGR